MGGWIAAIPPDRLAEAVEIVRKICWQIPVDAFM